MRGQEDAQIEDANAVWTLVKAAPASPQPEASYGRMSLKGDGRLHLLGLAALNLPFLLCHPKLPLVTDPFGRALGIDAILFVVPGLPLATCWPGRVASHRRRSSSPSSCPWGRSSAC